MQDLHYFDQGLRTNRSIRPGGLASYADHEGPDYLLARVSPFSAREKRAKRPNIESIFRFRQDQLWIDNQFKSCYRIKI